MRSNFLRIACGAALAASAFLIAGHSEKSLAQTDHGAPARYGQIDRARLLAANQHPGQWLTTGRDFGKSHYSPLAQIDKETVSRLGFAWGYDTHTIRGLEATPIVADGVMYASGPTGIAYALDAKTGQGIWTFDPKNNLAVNRESCCDEVNRGVAVWRGKVYVASFDGRLFALDAKTGAVVWHVDTIVDHKRGYTSTGAPQVAGSVVAIGNAGGEFDARGYVSAYDLKQRQARVAVLYGAARAREAA